MAVKSGLTVVPFTPKPVDPGRADRILEMKERISDPGMKAAICIILDERGEALMVSTNDDPMLVSYLYRIGDNIVSDYVSGEVSLNETDFEGGE